MGDDEERRRDDGTEPEVAPETLTAALAHDLNNVLAVVRASTELLERRLGPDGAALTEVRVVQHALAQASALTRRLSKLRDASSMRPVQLSTLVRGQLPLWQRLTAGRIQLEHHVQDDLPSVLGNPTDLARAMLNLVVNGIEAMPEGGRLTIDVRLSGPGGDLPARMVVIRVADEGTGMAPDLLARVWEPFFSTKLAKGKGLGLASVRRVVESHGGRVGVESELGGGSTFRIALPPAP